MLKVPLLVWPLSQQIKIVLNSQDADLATITCCDKLDMILYHGDTLYILQENITGCALSTFKLALDQLASGQQITARFGNAVLLGRDQFDQVLVEIRSVQKALSYSVVPLETIQSWAVQLDLLQVVMEENENEKKNRGVGCCG